MRKIIKRILVVTLLTFAVTITGVVTIILFPQLLFANKLEYKGFRVYSNEKISNDIIPVLDNSVKLVKESELYDLNYKFNVLLCYNSVFNKIDDKLLGFGPSARATLNHVTVKVRIDSKRDLFFPTFRKNCEGSLSTLLAHEMVHCLQANKYGIMKFNPLAHPEMWKLEGYPEYISQRPRLRNKHYNLVSEIDRYIKLEKEAKDNWVSIEEGKCEVPTYYYKGRIMIEYLMDIKHLSYDQILKDTNSEDVYYAEMLEWLRGINEERK